MKGNLKIDYEKALSQFERAIKKFQIRKIIYKSAFRGKGLEFDSYTNFSQDSDASLIDWKASLRANKLLEKQYIEERDNNFYFVVDCSLNMLFGSQQKLKAEYSGEVVAALSHLIINSSDGAGLVMFSDGVRSFLPPAKSRNQFFLIIKNLSDQRFFKDGFNFPMAVDYLLKNVPKSSVVILISDFLRVDRNIERKLRLLATKCETIAFMVRDPLDDRMPKEKMQLYVQDPRTGDQMIVDTELAAKQYEDIAEKQKRVVKEIFRRAQIDLLELHTDESFVVPVSSFLKKRAGGIKE